MNITTANYFDSVKNIDWNALPASLKKTHETLVPDASKNNWSAYHNDADVKRVIDKYFGFMEKYVSSPKTTDQSSKARSNKNANDKVPLKDWTQARLLAMDLIRHYVLRGDSLEAIAKSYLGRASLKDSVRVHGRKIIVSTLHRREVSIEFSLSSIFNEIKKEATGTTPLAQKKSSVKAMSKLPKPKLVTVIPTATSFIKRYAMLHGKVKTRDQIVSLVHGLQKAITEQRIRKTDPAISEIEKMQSELIELATSMGESVKIELDDKSLNHYKQIAQGEEVRTTVKLLKSFIAMSGKAKDKTKVSALYQRMEKALQVVPKEDPYLPELKTAMKALRAYESNKTIAIPAAALHGLGGVALRGHHSLGAVMNSSESPVIRLLRHANVKDLSDKTLKKTFAYTIAPGYFFELAKAYIRCDKLSMELLHKQPARGNLRGLTGIEEARIDESNLVTDVDVWDHRISSVPSERPSVGGLGNVVETVVQAPAMPEPQSSVSARELATMKFKTIGYNGRLKKVVGDPAIGFHMMVYGKPYNGKSSFVIELCKDLATLKKGRIAYLALEEGISLSMQKKVIDRGADKVEGLEFKGTMPSSFAGYGFVVIDSVSDRSISREQLRQLFLQNPQTCFICIFHATKDGTARGGLDFSHDMDIIIKIEQHEPIVEKNRFL